MYEVERGRCLVSIERIKDGAGLPEPVDGRLIGLRVSRRVLGGAGRGCLRAHMLVVVGHGAATLVDRCQP